MNLLQVELFLHVIYLYLSLINLFLTVKDELPVHTSAFILKREQNFLVYHNLPEIG